MDREAVQERFGIIGRSAGIQKVIDRIRLVARTDISVLITGESGVGKELAAQAIHALSGRRHKEMVIVNAGAIPEGLIESELFGSEKGSYTGSVGRKVGYFEAADGGTIFLDEVGEMPLNAQVRLLRVLESGEFSRVGSTGLQRTDVRVIAATNKDLAREVHARRFREDLYYRLSTVQIEIPPLRDRREDILPIFEHLHFRFAQQYNASTKDLNAEAHQLLLDYYWPGNARELRNVAEQTVVLIPGKTITADHLRPLLRGVTAGMSQSLVLATAPNEDPLSDLRDKELVYRMLLELRLELRELKAVLRDALEQRPAPAKEDLGFRESVLPMVRVDPADLLNARGRAPRPVPRERDDWLIEDAPYEIEQETKPPGQPTADPGSLALPTMEQAERTLILEALKRSEGNRRLAAETLGISERTLYRKLKDLESDGHEV